MDKHVEDLIKKHENDKNLTGEQNEITLHCRDWTNVNLSGWNLKGIIFSSRCDKANFTGAILTYAHLTGAVFNGAILTHVGLDYADLTDAKLINANLQYSHLFGAYLDGANLTNADFSNADLGGVRFSDRTNFTDIRLFQSNLKNSNLKNYNFKFLKDNKNGNIYEERNKKYGYAEDIYSHIKSYFIAEGHPKEAEDYFFKEKLVENRKLMKNISEGKDIFMSIINWIWNILKLFSSVYGRRPMYFIGWWFITIGIFELKYLYSQGLKYSNGNPVTEIIDYFYFSTVTFTTLGFGDIHPVKDWIKIFVVSESLIGAAMMAIFIVLLSRKIFR